MTAAAAAAAWLYGVFPAIAWGLLGGVCRGLAKPPEPPGFGVWLRIGLRSSLVGLVVGITLQGWGAEAPIPAALQPIFIWFVGFGARDFLDLCSRAWDWIGANPVRILRRIFRLPPE